MRSCSTCRMRALAEVRESFAQFGETDAAGDLPKQLPICGVMGDSQASLFAQRCYEPGMAKATFGSGTSVLLNVGDDFRPSGKGAVTALAWVRARPADLCARRAHQLLVGHDFLAQESAGLIRRRGETDALARSVEDNGGVYLVPAFSGLECAVLEARTPGRRSSA